MPAARISAHYPEQRGAEPRDTDSRDATQFRSADLRPADYCVAGRLDVTTAADLRADLVQLLEAQAGAPSPNGEDLVVDLSRVDAVDMVGVGLLVGVHRQAGRSSRRLVLTGVPPRVMRLLIATRLRRVLTVRDLPRPTLALVPEASLDSAGASAARAM